MSALDNAREALAAFDEHGVIFGPDVATALRDLIAEHEQVLDARDEVQEKIAYLRRNCQGLSEQTLRQKIGAVGAAEWKRGYYWNHLVREERQRANRAEIREREAERRADAAEARLAALTSDEAVHRMPCWPNSGCNHRTWPPMHTARCFERRHAALSAALGDGSET